MRRLPLLVLATSCAYGGPYAEGAPGGFTNSKQDVASSALSAELGQEAPTRSRLVAAARAYLGRRFRGDCSTFVRRVYSDVGLRLEMRPARKASEGLYLAMNTVDLPVPGDLAFFHDTYGRPARPGELRRLTHVALVEAVQGRIISLIHRGRRGITRIWVDLDRRHDRETNSAVRFQRRGDRPGTLYLAGELLTGFGSFPGLSSLRGLADRGN